MKSLPGNPHADALKLHQDFGNTLSPTVQATLALAYEQRTANLLAYMSLVGGLKGVSMTERLGLTDGN